jgi:hypothetical protein
MPINDFFTTPPQHLVKLAEVRRSHPLNTVARASRRIRELGQ